MPIGCSTQYAGVIDPSQFVLKLTRHPAESLHVLVPENETSTVYPIKDSDNAYKTHQIRSLPGFEGRSERKS
jgi:hypothetical protein